MSFAKKVRKNQAKVAVETQTFNPVVAEWGWLQETYIKHFRSGYNRSGNEEVYYTFFADMASDFNFHSGDKLLNVLKSYEKRMLNTFCKRDAQAFEIMIDSINQLAWLADALGDKYANITEWASNEYRRLFYKDWKQYVSEEQMEKIWYNLD